MKQKIPIIILISASIILLALITPSFLHNKQHEVSNNQLVASHVYGLIEGTLQRPIGISSGLSSDEFLIRTLEREEFTEEEKGFYDIQVIIESDTNTTQFPIIGYKHHSKAAYTWTKDR